MACEIRSMLSSLVQHMVFRV